MILRQLCKHLEEIAPPDLAAEGDNNGLLVGDPADDVQRVLLAIDLTDAVLAEAISFSAQLVICYHPPIFQPLRRLRADERAAGGRVFQAIRHHLAIYAMHTTLDAPGDGTNDALAEAIGLVDARPLAPHRSGPGEPGAYKLVTFVPPRSVDRVAEAISLAACCAGSCGELFSRAVAGGAGLYLTGELRHHDALAAAEAGMAVVVVRHSVSERLVLSRLAQRIGPVEAGLRVRLSESDTDPPARGPQSRCVGIGGPRPKPACATAEAAKAHSRRRSAGEGPFRWA